MKLRGKLTLFITLSKLLIVVLFVLLLPALVDYASFQYSNYYLNVQKKKVLSVIDKMGVDYYLQGDSAYASYTMLKEEYISLLPAENNQVRDTIETARRIVGEDTLNYRILIHQLKGPDKKYVLEIGKTTATINQYNRLLQRFTLFILIALILLSLIIDLTYTHILLRPLKKIVQTKLLNQKFPFKEQLYPIKTSTSDFRILDQSLIGLMEKIHEAFEKEREFTANASHELMTPISILQTNIENMMMEENLSGEEQEKIASMMKTVNRLKKVVRSLLYISRIDNDQFAKGDTVHVNEVANEIMDELSIRLEAKSIQFFNQLSKDIHVSGVNRDLFFQLLYNLVHNAIRYNREYGTITLADRWIEDSYVIEIKDTGTGIKDQELASIFSRFRSGKNKSEGFGLGLSIVKSIVSYLGFEIEVTSDYGKGTIFCIIIPPELIVKLK